MKTVLDDLDDEMSPDLAERTASRLGVVQSGSRHEAPRPRLRFATVAAAVVLVGGAAAGVWSIQSPSPDRAWQDRLLTLADDHEQVPAGTSFASNDADAVQRWLDERLPFSAHVPSIPDTRLEGARIGRVNGLDTATLVYAVDGEEISFYLTPADTSDPTRLAPAQIIGGRGPRSEFVAWQGDGLTHALVGDLPQDRLRSMAQFCLDMPGDGIR